MSGLVSPDLTAGEAREKVDKIRYLVAEAWDEIVDLYNGRAWLALGYPAWDAMCEAEFAGARIRLPREERREVVGSLREAGLSVRAIAAATGVAANTVRGDLSQTDTPAETTGIDGKRYPSSRPPTATERKEMAEAIGLDDLVAKAQHRLDELTEGTPYQAEAEIVWPGDPTPPESTSAAEDYRGRYPTIDRPSVPDGKAVEYGSYLDGLDEYERAGRLENLGRTLDNRDAGVKAPEVVEPEAVTAFHRLAEAIVEANSRTSRYRQALSMLLDDAKPYVDGMEWGLTLSAADDLRGLLGELLDHSRAVPNLRSVR